MASMLIEGREYFGTADAAEELGLSVETINKAVQRGRLRAERKVGNYNLFHRDELDRYREESLGQPGRRKTRKSA